MTDFLLESWQAAHHGTAATIRRVLRAVAVSALQQVLQQQQQRNDHDDEDDHRIVVMPHHVTAVQGFCQRLAADWSDRNAALGNESTAKQIRHLAQQGSACLYFGATFGQGAEEQEEEEATTTTVRVHAITTTEDGAASHNTAGTATNHAASSSTTNCLTAYARCQAIPAPIPSGNADNPDTATLLQPSIKALDRLGAQHATYWPETSWRSMQAAAAAIPHRLYRHQAQVASTNVHVLMDRKRKRIGRTSYRSIPGQETKKQRRRKKSATSQEEPPALSSKSSALVPRPPSLDNGTAQWTSQDIRQSLSATERHYLDRLVINDEHDEESPPSLILGSLLDLGHWHHYQQSAIDHSTPDGESWGLSQTPSRQRRHQRRSTTERLANHTFESSTTDLSGGRSAARRAQASRVAPTMSKTANPTSWRDLDLQHVVMEIYDPRGSGSRHVLAFDTLECILLDQDEAPSPRVV